MSILKPSLIGLMLSSAMSVSAFAQQAPQGPSPTAHSIAAVVNDQVGVAGFGGQNGTAGIVDPESNRVPALYDATHL